MRVRHCARVRLLAVTLFGAVFLFGHCVWAEIPSSLSVSAEQGNPDAQFRLGLIHYEGTYPGTRNYAEAFQWFQRAANQKNARAADYLGVMYQNGSGVPRNYTQAVRWYRVAVDEGSPFGLVFLGELYESGEGVPQDYAQAMQWYRRASDEAKSARAQWRLGLMYFDGKGVTQNAAEAIKWERRAADGNFVPALLALGRIYYAQENYPEALGWWRKAAEQDSAEAQLAVGDLYHEGKEGVPRDDAEASRWYRIAAKKGNATAQNKLSLMYFDGEGVPRDYAMSYVWASFSAAQGDTGGRKAINDLEVIMSPDQLAESQRMAREAQEGTKFSFFGR